MAEGVDICLVLLAGAVSGAHSTTAACPGVVDDLQVHRLAQVDDLVACAYIDVHVDPPGGFRPVVKTGLGRKACTVIVLGPQGPGHAAVAWSVTD